VRAHQKHSGVSSDTSETGDLAVRQAHRLSDSAPILSACDDPFGSEELCWAGPGSYDMALHDAVGTVVACAQGTAMLRSQGTAVQAVRKRPRNWRLKQNGYGHQRT
jgi:hypothetical protein